MSYNLYEDLEYLNQILDRIPDVKTLCGEDPDVIPQKYRPKIKAKEWKDSIDKDIAFELKRNEIKNL